MIAVVDDLQAVEPDALPRDRGGVKIIVSPDLDSMGFNRVAVAAPTRDALLAYVREQWGDDDGEWFQEWVVDRIREEPGTLCPICERGVAHTRTPWCDPVAADTALRTTTRKAGTSDDFAVGDRVRKVEGHAGLGREGIVTSVSGALGGDRLVQVDGVDGVWAAYDRQLEKVTA